MKNSRWMFVLCLVLLVVSVTVQTGAVDHTPAESNLVLKVMLNRLAFCAGDDAWTVESKPLDPLGNVRTVRNFVMGGQSQGWTFDECLGVFDGYLFCLATNDSRVLKPRELYLAKLALKQCDLLQYTNAASAYVALALNTNGVCRDRAIRLAVTSSGIGTNMTRFVESIFTNSVCYSEQERETAASVYASKILEATSSGESGLSGVDFAIAMFYRNRLLGSISCYPIDAVLCARLTGYSMSSNRLEVANNVLSSTDIDEDTRSLFSSITNQLLSSGQPLRQLNIGEAGE